MVLIVDQRQTLVGGRNRAFSLLRRNLARELKFRAQIDEPEISGAFALGRQQREGRRKSKLIFLESQIKSGLKDSGAFIYLTRPVPVPIVPRTRPKFGGR